MILAFPPNTTSIATSLWVNSVERSIIWLLSYAMTSNIWGRLIYGVLGFWCTCSFMVENILFSVGRILDKLFWRNSKTKNTLKVGSGRVYLGNDSLMILNIYFKECSSFLQKTNPIRTWESLHSTWGNTTSLNNSGW